MADVYQSRTEAFQQGVNGGGAQAQPAYYQPFSVLDQRIVSSDGMAAGPTGSARRLYGGGELPDPNGSSMSTYKREVGTSPLRSQQG